MQHDPNSFEKKWQKRFEKFANNNTDASIAGWSESGLRTRVQTFLDKWDRNTPISNNKSKSIWCDIGCGAGTYINLLHKFDCEVVGIDYSYPTLKQARKRVDKQPHWGQADVQHLSFKENTFDGVLCFGVLQALSTPNQAIEECSRVLKQDGSLWIDALNKNCFLHILQNFLRRLKNKPNHLHYLSANIVIESLKINGFKNLELQYVFLLPEKLKLLHGFISGLYIDKIIQKLPVINSLFCHSFMLVAKRG
jgi:ubiquinone/menaquinone biosynthesis C-methylase UbiE